MTDTKTPKPKPRPKPGRPPKYSAVEDMQQKIDDYFAECLAREKPPTVSGLAYALDMSTRALRDYEAKDEFLPTVKRAKQRVEVALEERLDGQAPAGAIFNLKNNFGWRDKTESEVSGPGGGPVETVTRIELVAPDLEE